MGRTKVCGECGSENPADGRFCLACDEVLLDAPRGSDDRPRDPKTGEALVYASLVERAIAIFIDGFLLLVASGVLNVIGLGWVNRSAWLAASLLSILYFVILTGSRGQTIGKKAVNIEVRKKDGSHVDFGSAALREAIGRPISNIPFLSWLAYPWALWDDKSQTWHDKMGGTVVVKSGVREPLGGAERPGAVRRRTEALGRTVEAWNIPTSEIREQIRSSVDAALKTSADAMAAWAKRERPSLGSQTSPDGTVTIMFVGIEGSAELTESLGDERMRQVITDVARFVSQEVDRCEGRVVKSLGDGFMLAFRSARRGLQCAGSIQRAAAVYRDTRGTRIHLRIGVHTGEVLHEEDDFYGQSVNMAARIADEARGGQILTSALVKGLCESSGEFEFDDGRQVDLRGIGGPTRIHAVTF